MKSFPLWKQHPAKPVSLWKPRRLAVILSVAFVAAAAIVSWFTLRK